MPLESTSQPVVYDDAVSREDVDRWESELASLLARIRPLFYRTESKKHAEQYMRGLLSPLERKNGWTIAEHAGELDPAALQRFVNLSPWDADALLECNREYAMEHLADPAGILVADPTGFAKKGTSSVGVQRQYSGTLGRIDNCQIATFLCYVTPNRDRVLVDRRLYMPEKSWMADPARCAGAGVPAELAFATRPEQVIEMIRAARAAGMPFSWFTADEEFGQNPGLCDYLETNHIPYVMAVPKNTQFTDTAGQATQVDDLARQLPRNTWQRRACGIGSKGHRTRQLPSPHLERLASTYHPRHAHPHLPRRHRTPRQKKGRQHATQPDQPENPSNASTEPDTTEPIHRRLIALTLAEIRRLLNLARRSEPEIRHGLHWSIFRRWHQAQAHRAHVRRHLQLQTLMI